MEKTLLKQLESEGFSIAELQASLDAGFITEGDLESRNIERDGRLYYNPDSFIIAEDGEIYPIDETWISERTGYVFHESVPSARVIYNGQEQIWAIREAKSDCSYFYEDIYYFSYQELGYHNLIVTDDTGRIMHQDEAYYADWGDWYEYEENAYSDDEEDNSSFVSDYHSGSYHSVNFTNNPTRFVGFEIEKEDSSVKRSMRISDFKDFTGGIWRKERDGSLSDDSGFELISPTFELCIDKIFEHIRGNNVLVNHINAKKSISCGGHIHLSVKGMTGAELFESIKGYVPLFYALYHKRSETSYCKAKPSSELSSDNEKYQAIQILSNRIEFRIISAVPDVDVLEWRARLLELILDNPTSCFRQAYENILKLKDFGNHLRIAYPEAEKYTKLKGRIKDMTTKFENISFNVSKFKIQQEEADNRYNEELFKRNFNQYIRNIKSALSSGRELKVVAKKVSATQHEWMFIGEIEPFFSKGDVLTVSNLKRGCAFSFVENPDKYYPISMFEIQS